jgi:DnaJ-class molecular chaperone
MEILDNELHVNDGSVCATCKGTGIRPGYPNCYYCDGTGGSAATEKYHAYVCAKCDGSGILDDRPKCFGCGGTGKKKA